MIEDALATARRLAEALDAEEYSAAPATLAEGCVYHTATAALVGPEAVIGSCRANAEAARGRFDEIHYASRADPSGAWGAVITYTDRVRCGDAWHESRCRQHVRIGAAGLVEEIRHEELPGERERLQEFEQRRTTRGSCPRTSRGNGPKTLGLDCE